MKKSKRTVIMSFALMATMLFVVLSGCGNTELQRELEILPTRFDTEYNICEARFTITLTSETSLKFLHYTVADFPAVFSELRLASVEEITPDWEWGWAMDMLSRLETGDWSGHHWTLGLSDEEITERVLSALSRRFTRVLSITLAEPSRVNVLQAMRIFEEREDVLYVTPDFLPWPGINPEFEESVMSSFRGWFHFYFGTFNGVVVFAQYSGPASPSVTDFYWYGRWYSFGFPNIVSMRAWVPCENNEDGNIFIIGYSQQWLAAEICWKEILTIDHVRSMFHRHTYLNETRLWRYL